jgi:hypothetical protein
MKDITIILPIHKLGLEDGLMLNNAIASVNQFNDDVKLTIVCPDKLMVKLEEVLLEFKYDKLDIKCLPNTTNETDFVSQLTLGINNCDTEWFSILEIDDEYKSPWLSSIKKYIQSYTSVDVFLPIIRDINVEGKFLSFMNESVWAYGFSTDQGFIDKDLLMEYQNYQTSGGVYRTKVIKENGGLKNNIKLTFSYEFLLRLVNNGVKILVVPRIGYQHVNLRENSLFWLYKNDEKMRLSEDEVKFWLETAKKEFYFKNKRDVKYDKQ